MIDLLIVFAFVLGLGAFIFMTLNQHGKKNLVSASSDGSVSVNSIWRAYWSPKTKIIGNFVEIPGSDGCTGTIVQEMSLVGKKLIRLHFSLDRRVEAEELPGSPATITLFFQRKGDNWTAKGEFETYRWFASPRTIALLPGEYVIEHSLDDLWTATMVSSSESNRGMFLKAIEESEQVGFVLGGADGLAHGVIGPAILTIHSFEVL